MLEDMEALFHVDSHCCGCIPTSNGGLTASTVASVSNSHNNSSANFPVAHLASQSDHLIGSGSSGSTVSYGTYSSPPSDFGTSSGPSPSSSSWDLTPLTQRFIGFRTLPAHSTLYHSILQSRNNRGRSNTDYCGGHGVVEPDADHDGGAEAVIFEPSSLHKYSNDMRENKFSYFQNSDDTMGLQPFDFNSF